MKTGLAPSIKQRTIMVILLVTSICTIGGFTLEILNNNRVLRNELERNASLNAKLISEFATPTLLFNDNLEAYRILEKLDSIPFIAYASIVDDNNSLFAMFSRKSNTFLDNAYNFERDTIIGRVKLIKVHEPIFSRQEYLGDVTIVASDEIITDQLSEHIMAVIIILIVILAFAYILASIAQRIITRPILELADTTKIVHETGDLTARAVKISNDETGLLVDQFNELMEKLEEKNAERNKIEQELKNERENLEFKVAERTSELNAAKIRAEESDRLKSAFLANMSHEIRTPLNAILGFSELLLQPQVTDEMKEDFKNIIEINSKDLLSLINDILDLSKIEANQLTINPQKIPINNTCLEIFWTFGRAFEREYPGSEVENHLEVPDPAIDYILSIDPLRFRQIMINILGNAMKFTSSGEIRFGYKVNEEEQTIVFYVKDSGIGIPVDKMDKVFDRFIKVSDNKVKHYKGSGLGLSISLKLARLMGGNIKVESEESKGSTFYVTFPYIEKITDLYSGNGS